MTITYWPPATKNEILTHQTYRALGYKLPDVVEAFYSFQDAVPCFHPDWQLPTAKERKAFKLAGEQARREAIAIFKRG